MREVPNSSSSGGADDGNKEGGQRPRKADYRNLSNSSRAARSDEQPWRKRFREQCLDRLHSARDQSMMKRRQLTHPDQIGDNDDDGDSDTGIEQQDECIQVYPTGDHDISEEDMCRIIQQEWARFKAEMEQQSLEYGILDNKIFDDIEDDLNYSISQQPSAGADDRGSCGYASEYADWEDYENQLLEEHIIEEALINMNFDDLADFQNE
ncbi:hypothetical protein GGF37_002461 [Kickxella alabastrina]|nr:hypothetical protein GGF37_002461 [Kickxella alabastrina]